MPSMLEIAERQVRGEVPPPPIARTTGLKMRSIGAGHAVFELDVDERFYNPMGTVHGGVVTLVADSAMGMAFASTLEDGQAFTTIELKANFLLPVRNGTLVATARVVQRGRNIGLTECDVMLDGRLIARTMSTCMALPIAPAE